MGEAHAYGAAHTPVLRRDDIRARNDIIAAAARSHKFDDGTGMPLICECDSDACAEFVPVSLLEYRRARGSGFYIVARGHPFRGIAEEAGAHEYLLYRAT